MGGHGNVFFSLTDADAGHEFQYEGLFYGIEDVREGYKKKAEDRAIPWFFVKKKPGLDFSSYRKIIGIIKRSSPDILFLHSSAYIFPAKLAALFAAKKTRIIIRETQPNHLKTRAEWVGLTFSLLAANKIIFLSKEYRDAIKKKFGILFPRKKTKVIPNGINLDIFKPVPKPFSPIVKIGMQSRLSASKDHSTLINAFELLLNKLQEEINIELWIAGDGECMPQLVDLTKELSITDKVIFTGLLEETELPAFINSLNIYVHATTGETMSTAIMQVMACKVPVIASDVLGVNNMVLNEVTGLLVPVNDAEKMADAIYLLLKDAAIRNKISEKAYRFAVDNYSNKKMFNSYREVFLNSRPPESQLPV